VFYSAVCYGFRDGGVAAAAGTAIRGTEKLMCCI